jgi:hypothetical protein
MTEEQAKQQRAELPRAEQRVFDAFLPTILGYVGPAQWFFVAPVCKLWHQLYSEPAKEIVEIMGEESHMYSRISITVIRSAFISLNRLILAYKHGLPA